MANLLEVRLQLAPAYTGAAVALAGKAVASSLDGRTLLLDAPAAYASFDWQLHKARVEHLARTVMEASVQLWNDDER